MPTADFAELTNRAEQLFLSNPAAAADLLRAPVGEREPDQDGAVAAAVLVAALLASDEPEEAEATYARWEAEFHELPTVTQQAAALIVGAKVALDLDDPETALDRTQDVLAMVAKGSGEAADLATTQSEAAELQATALDELGETEDAIEAWQDAIDRAVQLGATDAEWDRRVGLVRALIEDEQTDAAQQTHEELRAHNRRLPAANGEPVEVRLALADVTVGEAWSESENPELGLEPAASGLADLQAAGRWSDAARAAWVLGWTQYYVDDFSAARQSFALANELADKGEPDEELADLLDQVPSEFE